MWVGRGTLQQCPMVCGDWIPAAGHLGRVVCAEPWQGTLPQWSRQACMLHHTPELEQSGLPPPLGHVHPRARPPLDDGRSHQGHAGGPACCPREEGQRATAPPQRAHRAARGSRGSTDLRRCGVHCSPGRKHRCRAGHGEHNCGRSHHSCGHGLSGLEHHCGRASTACRANTACRGCRDRACGRRAGAGAAATAGATGAAAASRDASGAGAGATRAAAAAGRRARGAGCQARDRATATPAACTANGAAEHPGGQPGRSCRQDNGRSRRQTPGQVHRC